MSSEEVKLLKEKPLVEFFENILNIKLEKAGKNYCCPCPIHEDTKPSFYVNPEKNKCACYGSCGFKGDILDFVQKYKQLTFPEGVKWLCEKYGIKSKSTYSAKKNDNSEYYDICKFTYEFYHSILLEKKNYISQILNYVRSKKLTKNVITEFYLGAAPDPSSIGTWTFFFDQLIKQKFSLSKCEEIGIIRKSKIKDKYYDAFLGRFIIPLFDQQDRCIGFNTRKAIEVKDDDNLPKYLLSKKSPIFDKSKYVYGLNKTYKYIKSSNECKFVEGCSDFWKMYDWGHKNVIPLLGGKIIDINVIPSVDNYIHFMDPDKAGIKYAIENSIALIQKEKNNLIVELDKDPDESSKEEIKEKIGKALTFIEYYLKHHYKYPTSAEHKLNLLDDLSKRFDIRNKKLSKEQIYLYVKELSNQLSIAEKIILYRFGLEDRFLLQELIS